MDPLAAFVDLSFLLLALLLIYQHGPAVGTGHNDQGQGQGHGQANAQAHVHDYAGLASPRSPRSFGTMPIQGAGERVARPCPGAESDLDVPSITLTPSLSQRTHIVYPGGKHPLPGPGGAASRHKRKSVAFSLSSMDDLLPPNPAQAGRYRPPTPFRLPARLAGPAPRSPALPQAQASGQVPSGMGMTPINNHPSPIRIIHSADPLDGVPTPDSARHEMRHSPNAEDPMGVRKQWLMA